MNGMTTGVIEQPKARAPSASKIWLKAIELTARIETLSGRLFADVVDDWARRQPDRAALVMDDASLDYDGLSKRINRYARWALSVGVAKGDTVGLIMPNGIDYVAAWLGISRVGGVVALINTKLVGQSLAHCIDVAKPVHIIVAHELAGTLDSATPHLKTEAKIWTHGDAHREHPARIAVDALRQVFVIESCVVHDQRDAVGLAPRPIVDDVGKQPTRQCLDPRGQLDRLQPDL